MNLPPLCVDSDWEHTFVPIEQNVSECTRCGCIMVVTKTTTRTPVPYYSIGRAEPEMYDSYNVEVDVNYYKDLDTYMMEKL